MPYFRLPPSYFLLAFVSIGIKIKWRERYNIKSELDKLQNASSKIEDVRLCVAASSYLNTAPLIWSFTRGNRRGEIDLITDTAPARCALMLTEKEVAAALVPVIEYQRIENLVVVPRVCVGSRFEVRSVVLATRAAKLSDIKTIALDTSSRTSAALIQIIFREFLRVTPHVAPFAPDVSRMLETYDAALIIGDPAMTFGRADLRVFDLAALWREYTGCGFVFAMWMARGSEMSRVRQIDFAAARDEGLAKAEEIAASYATELNLPHAELNTYLRENICYELDEDLRAGLGLFYQLSHKHDLTPHARELRLLE